MLLADGASDGNGGVKAYRDGEYPPNPYHCCTIQPSPWIWPKVKLVIFWINSEIYFFRDPVFGGSPYPLQYGGCAVPGLQVRLPLDSLVQGENISSQLGENISSQLGEDVSTENIFGENISGEDISKENFSKENISEENISKENISEENISSENISGQISDHPRH